MTQKQFEDLQHELEVQTELAEKRLQEINTLSNHNQELNTKVAQLNNNVSKGNCFYFAFRLNFYLLL